MGIADHIKNGISRRGFVLGGAAAGAATGAVGGAIVGGAAIGSIAGAATGLTAVIISSMFQKPKNNPVFENFVNRCLQERGYEIIGWE